MFLHIAIPGLERRSGRSKKMASPVKKRVLNENNTFNGNNEKSESSDESSESSDMEEHINQEV
jgi:hypothetical protein